MTTAVKMLQPSVLHDQKQLIASDLELSNLNLALKGSASISIVESIVDGEVTRTIEGASTVVITLLDRDREILNSGRLGAKVDINIDGLWFRLTGVNKSGDTLTLTFEDREVALLRTYKDHIVVARNSVSRAQFIKRMVDSVKEMWIPFVCPEIDKLPPIRSISGQDTHGESAYRRDPGFAPWTAPGGGKGFTGDITVSRAGGPSLPATTEQLENTSRVLAVGASRGASYTCMVAAVIVINEESSARNVDHSSDGLSAGLFQQIYEPHKYAWGTKAEVMNIEWAANRFFDGAIAAYQKNPSLEPEYIALAAQVAGNQEARIIPIWRKGREEAERTVARWGVPVGTLVTVSTAKSRANMRAAQIAQNNQGPTVQDEKASMLADTGGDLESLQLASGDYQFHRGIAATVDGQEIWKPESSWECSGRLAEEINWRRFMVSGSFYLMSEGYLFRSKPVMKITEDSPGVISIDGDYIIGTKNATAKVICHIGRWEAPPGSMIELFKVGLISGRWLVSEVRRSLFDTSCEITLKKPRPVLAEPNLDQEKGLKFSVSTGFQPSTFPGPGEAASPDTTVVPTSDPKALAALRVLINNGRVDLSDHPNDRSGLLLSGSVMRSDGALVPIDPQVIKFLVWAGDQYGVRASCIVGTHDRLVKGSTHESRHWTGHAVDLGSVLNVRVDHSDSKGAVMQFMRAVKALPPGLIPNQMICNGCGYEMPDVKALQLNNSQPDDYITGGHLDHIHIGY